MLELVSGTGSLWLEHRLGVGVRRPLFLSISLWARLDSDFFFTVSRNLVPKEAKTNQKITFLFFFLTLEMSGTTRYYLHSSSSQLMVRFFKCLKVLLLTVCSTVKWIKEDLSRTG